MTELDTTAARLEVLLERATGAQLSITSSAIQPAKNKSGHKILAVIIPSPESDIGTLYAIIEIVNSTRALLSERRRLREALAPFAELHGDDVNMNDPLSKWLTVANLADAKWAMNPANGGEHDSK